MTMEYASTIDIGARKQRRDGINEDAIATAVFENHHRQTERPVGIFVLGDGVGGEACGDVAAFLATTVVRKRLTDALLGPGTDIPERFGIDSYEPTPPTADADSDAALSEARIRTAIQDGIDAAHKHVQEFARDIGGRPATTLVVGVYVDGHLHYGWVGDSRIYLINERHEETKQLTRDHAVTNDLLENGEIDDEVYARIHPDATAITNAVGGSAHGQPSVDVEFGSTEIYRDDIILFTSDGLVDAFPDNRSLRQEYQQATDTAAAREAVLESLVTDDEIREIVLEADDLRDAVAELVSFANDRGGKDNLSVTLARDPGTTPSPNTPPFRGTVADSRELTDQETVIEPAEETGGSDPAAGSESTSGETEPTDVGNESTASPDESDGESGRSPPEGGTAKVVSAGEGDPPTAAVTIAGDETIFEVVDGVTIGRTTADRDRNPNIGLVVDDDDPVESNHARLEFDDDGYWRIRDISAVGTFVEATEGEGRWAVLLSSEGAALHRQHGFDPDAAAEGDLEETTRLRDGTAFTLEDPRKENPITFRFFSSVDHARNRTRWSDPNDGRPFGGFCT
ncbi:protein phosphatase 2C domain-containing protein [Natrinema salaciae]|uniref:Serine/threonine protein phosphatase PrpC n=1 Tax=Natrinema salaciae TaxID=1186196 RepID=A0A1H9M976_9EURY|nr:protein phosphatase 2C domain-containing protein [Natrinema salaciae]SER20234.1 Serine/threonine protein phosphatase PrpC [Natrinema salaciae]